MTALLWRSSSAWTFKQLEIFRKTAHSGLSYLRQFSANVATGALEQVMCSIAGFGRMAFDYPQFARDVLRGGCLKPEQRCLACGKCSELMRHGSQAGCVMRDQVVYLPLYRSDAMGTR